MITVDVDYFVTLPNSDRFDVWGGIRVLSARNKSRAGDDLWAIWLNSRILHRCQGYGDHTPM